MFLLAARVVELGVVSGELDPQEGFVVGPKGKGLQAVRDDGERWFLGKREAKGRGLARAQDINVGIGDDVGDWSVTLVVKEALDPYQMEVEVGFVAHLPYDVFVSPPVGVAGVIREGWDAPSSRSGLAWKMARRWRWTWRWMSRSAMGAMSALAVVSQSAQVCSCAEA